MPSKEDICVVSDPPTFLSTDMEELVAAIKHNLHLKSRKPSGVYSRQRRLTPYAAPVRSLCRSKTNSDQHSPATCKYCLLKSDHNKDPEDPYEILTYLRKGILISEAVKRLQMDCSSPRTAKKRDFYELENPDEFFDLKSIESV